MTSPRLEGEGIGAEFDQFGHAEDHLARIALLHDFTVEEAADAEILGIRHLVGGHKGGTDGAEGVEALPRIHWGSPNCRSRALTSLAQV